MVKDFFKKTTDLLSPEKLQDSFKLALREYSEAIIITFVVAILLRFFVVSAYKIPTISMAPTLKSGDFIFAYKMPFVFAKSPEAIENYLKRGDLVIFKCPQSEHQSCVKRVVGLPGDKIQIIKKRLKVNNKLAEYQALDQEQIKDLPGKEAYAVIQENLKEYQHSIIIGDSSETESFGPIVVPPQQFFVLGDNRDTSDDSRSWGALPIKNIEGKVLFIWLSLDWQRPWVGQWLPSVRWERVFSKVH